MHPGYYFQNVYSLFMWKCINLLVPLCKLHDPNLGYRIMKILIQHGSKLSLIISVGFHAQTSIEMMAVPTVYAYVSMIYTNTIMSTLIKC